MRGVNRILLLESQKSVRLFLKAVVRSVDLDAEILCAAKLSEGKAHLKRGQPIHLVILGFLTEARKGSFLHHLKEKYPGIALFLVKNDEISLRRKKSSDSSSPSPYTVSSLEIEACRKNISRLLRRQS